MIQLLIAVFGITSIWLAMAGNPVQRKWSPIIGLAGQPFWGWFAWQSQGWGLGALVLAYTLVYLHAIRLLWGPEQ